MSVLPHPTQPADPNWVLLSDFATGHAELRPEHRRWLDEHAVPALCADPPAWVFIRGFASRLGAAPENMQLSRRRAEAVRAHLLEHPCTAPDRITAVEAVGEAWGPSSSPRDDSARWRAAEVILTRARRPPAPRQRPIPRPVRLIRRRIRCRVINRPNLTVGRGHGGGDHGEEITALGEAVHKLINPEYNVACDLHPVRDDHRVVRIRIFSRDVSSSVATGSVPTIEYGWGPPAGETVALVDERDPRNVRRRQISRAVAHRWYTTPGYMLDRF